MYYIVITCMSASSFQSDEYRAAKFLSLLEEEGGLEM